MGGGTINCTPVAPWTIGKASNVYTQFGEDGLIAAALTWIGETNRQCFEIGAADGLFWSNTLRLRELGWQAVLIESDESQFQKLHEQFGQVAECIHETCTDLDETLAGTKLDLCPDLGVIDIDGQDYWLWHDLQVFRPRIMLVEIATIGADAPIPPRGSQGPEQAGLTAIWELGLSKDYELIAHTHCNAVFIDGRH